MLAIPWSEGMVFFAYRYQRGKAILSNLDVSNCLRITDVNSCEICVLCLALCLLNVLALISKNLSADALVTMHLHLYVPYFEY